MIQRESSFVGNSLIWKEFGQEASYIINQSLKECLILSLPSVQSTSSSSPLTLMTKGSWSHRLWLSLMLTSKGQWALLLAQTPLVTSLRIPPQLSSALLMSLICPVHPPSQRKGFINSDFRLVPAATLIQVSTVSLLADDFSFQPLLCSL